MFDFLGVFQEYRLKAIMLTLRYVNRVDVPGGMEYPYLQKKYKRSDMFSINTSYSNPTQ